MLLNKTAAYSLSHLHYLSDNRLSSVSFSQDDITKIIQNLDLNKAHGHDNISIHMLNICGLSIYNLLEMIFKQCIETGVFLLNEKRLILQHVLLKNITIFVIFSITCDQVLPTTATRLAV